MFMPLYAFAVEYNGNARSPFQVLNNSVKRVCGRLNNGGNDARSVMEILGAGRRKRVAITAITHLPVSLKFTKICSRPGFAADPTEGANSAQSGAPLRGGGIGKELGNG